MESERREVGRGHWGNWVHEGNGLDRLAAAEGMRSCSGGILKVEPQDLLKGLNVCVHIFVSLSLYFLWPKTLERWTGHWRKTLGKTGLGEKFRDSLLEPLGLRQTSSGSERKTLGLLVRISRLLARDSQTQALLQIHRDPRGARCLPVETVSGEGWSGGQVQAAFVAYGLQVLGESG